MSGRAVSCLMACRAMAEGERAVFKRKGEKKDKKNKNKKKNMNVFYIVLGVKG